MQNNLQAFFTKFILVNDKNLRHSRQERGAALIVVLLVLILIMLVGAIAVRRSQTDLNLATSDQINTLLLQGADGANVQLENLVNGPISSEAYQRAVDSRNGIIGHYFANVESASKDELSFCFNPREAQTSTRNATVRRGTGFFDGLQNGNCDADDKTSYVSGRQTVMTQVSIFPVEMNASNPFEAAPEAVSLNNDSEGAVKQKFAVRATSSIPSYNSPGTCFNNSSAGLTAVTLLECLRQQQVPAKQILQQIDVFYNENGFKCIDMGKGTGAVLKVDDGSGGNKCTLS